MAAQIIIKLIFFLFSLFNLPCSCTCQRYLHFLELEILLGKENKKKSHGARSGE